MNFESALIIREPWITKILNGEKTWEMRSKPTSKRGWIGLVAQGGNHVLGAARLVDSRLPLTRKTYSEFEAQHAIPPDLVDDVMANNWVFPWVLTDVVRFDVPVPYETRPGAVQFVTLDRSVGAVCDQAIKVGTTRIEPTVKTANVAATTVAAAAPRATDSSQAPVFVFAPEQAHARGVPGKDGEFIVLAGSTAMKSGSAMVKRNRELRDQLVRNGHLVPSTRSDLYEFPADYVFSSASTAAGVVKDGNASGPSLWKRPDNAQSLKDYLERGTSL